MNSKPIRLMIEINRYWCFLFPYIWDIWQIFSEEQGSGCQLGRQCSRAFVWNGETLWNSLGKEKFKFGKSVPNDQKKEKDPMKNKKLWSGNMFTWRNKSNLWCWQTNVMKVRFQVGLFCSGCTVNILYLWSDTNFYGLHQKQWCVHRVEAMKSDWSDIIIFT